MEGRKIIQVEDKVPLKLLVPLSIQHMFAMFGASVLVPFMFGISPAIVLFMNGVGTLLFIAITKGKAPAYLGSSFAFLAPGGIIIDQMGYEDALGRILRLNPRLYHLQVRMRLDRHRAASGGHGACGGPHRTGALQLCGQQRGASG